MSAQPYVRLHTEILGDPKLLRAARKGHRELELAPWLIAFAGDAGHDGRLTVGGDPADPEDVAARLPGVTPDRVAACLRSLEAIGVFERDPDGPLRFARWAARAGKPSDELEAVRERVAKHRAKTRGDGAPDRDRVRDPSNHAKLLHDALTGLAVGDDGQLDDVRYLRGPPDAAAPRVEPTLTPMVGAP